MASVTISNGNPKDRLMPALSAGAIVFLSIGSVALVRRLLLLVAVLVFVDTMLYAALTPLLPHFAHDLHFSKARAGTLVAAYAAGALVGGLPGGWASARMGARRAVLVGLVGMGLASVGFAFADSFSTLFLARFLQGLGSAFTWAGSFSWLLAAAPRERRGELIGSAMGAAVFGALFGPVIGAAAALAGRAVIFCALAGLVGRSRGLDAPARLLAARAGPVARGAPASASQPATGRGPRVDVGALPALRGPGGARPAASLPCRLGCRGNWSGVARRSRASRRCRHRLWAASAIGAARSCRFALRLQRAPSCRSVLLPVRVLSSTHR